MSGSVKRKKSPRESGQSRSLALRARDAVEGMGSAILQSRTEVAQEDLAKLFYELRIVVLRVLILSCVQRRTEVVTSAVGWGTILELDLETQLFHVEQLGDDRIWSPQSVSAVRREYLACGGKWFGDVADELISEFVGEGFEVGEIGAVDEYLMGLTASVGDDGGFVLRSESESERKSGGVFYTPASLVGYVLDRSLTPAIEGCGMDVEALLGLRVCDPACGCGYFLVEAARRISDRIAEVGGGDRLGDVVQRCVVGGDVNPVTAEVCRWSLWLEAGDVSVTIDSLRGNVVCGDALVDVGMFGEEGFGWFDVVVGNPPFLNQLGSGTARSKERVAKLRELGLVGSATYTDEASAFFVLGLGLVGEVEEKRRPPPSAKRGHLPRQERGRSKIGKERKIGRVCMVQPQSVVATRGGEWMRARVAEVGRLESIWVSNEHVFGDASVYTCSPCVVVGEEDLPQRSQRAQREEGVVRRFSGGEFVEHEPLSIFREDFGGLGTWSSIVAVTMGVPEVGIVSDGVVGDVAVATADFRDEYYGLVGKLVEDSECVDSDRDGSPAVLTTGLVDLGVSYWGKKATRIHKRKWESPRVAAAGIVGDERLSKWVDARRVEKVVVATQTKVVEAFVDFSGEYVVLTPMISVMVKEREDMEKPKTASPWHPEKDVWMVGAAIGSPVCSVFAMRHFGGAAMHADALKMSARQVLGLPLPGDLELWEEGAGLFERVHVISTAQEKTPSDRCAATSPVGAGEGQDGGRGGEEQDGGYVEILVQYGEVMCGAYGVEGDDLVELMGWWLGRLGIG